MLSITINKNVEEYKETVVAGLDIKETVYAGVAFVLAAGITAFLYFIVHISMMVGVYISLFVCAPICLIGFGNKNDVTAKERFLFFLQKGKKICKYMSTESAQFTPKSEVKVEEKSVESKEEFDKKAKKLMTILIASIVGVIFILVAVTFLLKIV